MVIIKSIVILVLYASIFLSRAREVYLYVHRISIISFILSAFMCCAQKYVRVAYATFHAVHLFFAPRTWGLPGLKCAFVFIELHLALRGNSPPVDLDDDLRP